MIQKKHTWGFLVVLAGLLFGAPAFAATTGFIEETIQIEKININEGDEVELVVGFSNNESGTLTGKVNFYNKDELLGSRELTLEGGQTGEYILNWTAVLGDHSFVARAENLKLEGSSVTILGPATEPKEITIGFKNSDVAERLREQGGFGAIVAGVLDEVREFFVPIIESLDEWRISRIEPLETTKTRIDNEKETEEGKMRPLFVIHSLALAGLLFITTHKWVFFTLVVLLFVWGLVRIVRLFKRIIRKDYSDEPR